MITQQRPFYFTGLDGSLYIGDYNMIRRLYPNGTVTTILQFPKSQVNECLFILIFLSIENIDFYLDVIVH